MYGFILTTPEVEPHGDSLSLLSPGIVAQSSQKFSKLIRRLAQILRREPRMTRISRIGDRRLTTNRHEFRKSRRPRITRICADLGERSPRRVSLKTLSSLRICYSGRLAEITSCPKTLGHGLIEDLTKTRWSSSLA